ncbi:phosphoenolpyruvate--protein phosphotransferase [Gallaecimonas sp. GXIMD4217]|uniref:phosphoenolpyruvate--protein phosphotransferase n=1 Tax=Gallaecimonas sp. GXIMD4217 TaxID=3131927 RepID=UPI00311B40BC
MQVEWRGISISPGAAIGPALTLPPADLTLDFTPCPAAQCQAECQRFDRALATASSQLSDLAEQAHQRLGDEVAALFAGLQLLVTDPELHQDVLAAITDDRLKAEAAVYRVLDRQARDLHSLDDAYLSERAHDLRDLARRLVHILQERMPPDHISLDQPVILLANELTPAQLTLLDADKLLGLVTLRGGKHSHAAILARALGVPAISGCMGINQIRDGQALALDADQGRLYQDPSDVTKARLAPQCAVPAQAGPDERGPARTRDGREVGLALNISTLMESALVARVGAQEVGLCRTEFLFLHRHSAPTVERQSALYRQIARDCAPAPVTFRLLDAGADKPLPWLGLEEEPNPALGWHGIRILIDRPDVLDAQLRALLDVSREYEVRILLPMITAMEEVDFVKERILALAEELGVPVPTIGAMIETPAAALLADLLAVKVDFFSIGTNDLMQYTLAVDRDNVRVADRLGQLSPALLRLLAQVCSAAKQAGIPVSLCGELAANPQWTPLWLALGIDTLSMGSAAVPAIRHHVATLDAGHWQARLAALIGCQSAADIAALLPKA